MSEPNFVLSTFRIKLDCEMTTLKLNLHFILNCDIDSVPRKVFILPIFMTRLIYFSNLKYKFLTNFAKIG